MHQLLVKILSFQDLQNKLKYKYFKINCLAYLACIAFLIFALQ
jgi:hypothetical protein